jgi:hypothetical protein
LVDRSLRIADVSLVRPVHAVWLGLASQLAALRGDLEQAQLRSYEAVRAASHVDDFGVGGFGRGNIEPCSRRLVFTPMLILASHRLVALELSCGSSMTTLFMNALRNSRRLQ